jgi:hypothetical protein
VSSPAPPPPHYDTSSIQIYSKLAPNVLTIPLIFNKVPQTTWICRDIHRQSIPHRWRWRPRRSDWRTCWGRPGVRSPGDARSLRKKRGRETSATAGGRRLPGLTSGTGPDAGASADGTRLRGLTPEVRPGFPALRLCDSRLADDSRAVRFAMCY